MSAAPTEAEAWTEDAVLAALHRHHIGQSWAPVPQVTIARRDLDGRADLSGWDRHLVRGARGDWTDRRIDMLLVRPAQKHGIGDLETLAVEVKVTRGDFLADVKRPEKQAPWREAATRHAYACPEGLIDPSEVPDGSGLLLVSRNLAGWPTVQWAKRAPYRQGHAPQPVKRVILGLAHRVATLEARTRGWINPDGDPDDPQALRAQLAAARKDAEKAHRALSRERDKTEAWRTAHALAAPTGHPCAWCARPVKPLNPTGGWFKKWRHVDPADDDPCTAAEVAAVEAEARAEYAAATEADRRDRLRWAQRWALAPLFETDPWRTFLPPSRVHGQVDPSGPRPADVTPTEGRGNT